MISFHPCLWQSLPPTIPCPLGTVLTDLLAWSCLLHPVEVGASPADSDPLCLPLTCMNPAPCPAEAVGTVRPVAHWLEAWA